MTRNRGQILIMTLLALAILVGLFFFVYATGRQVNNRMTVQHAADAAVISGTVQMARHMNLVAMNNIESAQMIGAVPVLDSIPLATEMALNEVSAWEAALSAQLQAGIPNEFGEGPLIVKGLQSLQLRMASERDILIPVDATLNRGGFNMANTTWWDPTAAGGSATQGALWQSAKALQEFSAATVSSSGPLSQRNAVRWGMGQRSDSGNPIDLAFITPILPSMPAYEGKFEDFRPILGGIEQVNSHQANFVDTYTGAGGAIPDIKYPHRLGPYAKLMRWRHPWVRWIGGSPVPPSGNIGGIPGGGGRQIGTGAPNFGGGWTGGTAIVMGYSTYGPVHWSLNMINDWSWRRLPDTYFMQYVSRMTRIKMGYMFGQTAIRQIHKPDWKSSYEEAKRLGSDRNNRPYQTLYYCVRIFSSVPEGDPKWLTAGTYWTNADNPLASWFRGWLDMDRLVNPNPNPNPPPNPRRRPPRNQGVWTRVGNYIWKEKATGYSTEWTQIGIYPKQDKDGSLIQQPVYFVELRVFGGLDVGKRANVTNPCNWSGTSELPRPWLLVTSPQENDYNPYDTEGDKLTGVRRRAFTFLGSARAGTDNPTMQNQFRTDANPSGHMVAVAQAELFNNNSWDLWTQDWRAQLVPVTRWDDWIVQMDEGAEQAAASNSSIQAGDITEVAAYLKRISPTLANLYINH